MDPAIDHAGRRLDEHLTRSIAELKARDMDDTPTAPLGGTTVTLPPAITELDILKASLGSTGPMPKPAAAPIAKAPTDKFALIAKKVAGVQNKMHTRADRLAARVDAFDKKVDDTFDRQEDAVSAGEAIMDRLEASLATAGNEEPGNG